jgi:hypothetical protein
VAIIGARPFGPMRITPIDLLQASAATSAIIT